MSIDRYELSGSIDKKRSGLSGDVPAARVITGASAYEIAKANGFVGTEEAWLESLKGRPGDPGQKGDDYILTEEDKKEIAAEAAKLVDISDIPGGGSVDLTGYATEEWVKGYAQPKGDYLDATDLHEAINTALDLAKASGAFDGPPGEPGKDYVLTEEDKTEIAEIAAEMVEVPESGGNVDWLDPEEGEVFTAIVSTPDVPVIPDEPDEPDVPVDPEITLTSISATYTGGNVTVGTAVTDLTGITVTATYSDGSTAPVTDYTLSGTIAEGSNTITVSYGGKTTTFTVTGEAEENGEDFTGTENAFERDGYLYINTLTINQMFDMSYGSDQSDYHETIWRTDNGGGLFDASALSDGTIFNGVVKQTASSADEPYYVDAGAGNAWFYIPLDDWNNAGGSPAAYLYTLTERFPIKLASSYDVFDFSSDKETLLQGSKYFTAPSISNGFIVGSIFFAMDIKAHPVCNVNAFVFTSGETECYKIEPYASGWTAFYFSIPANAFDNDLSNVSIDSIVEYVRSIGLKFWGGAA